MTVATDFHKHIDAKESEQQSGCSTRDASNMLSVSNWRIKLKRWARARRELPSPAGPGARTSTGSHVCTGDQEHESHRDKQHQRARRTSQQTDPHDTR